jgi:recombinational DNA repair protein (RecF pathway)
VNHMSRRESSLLAEKGKGILLPVCMICEQTPPTGIAGGMLVSGRFLCSRCEREIVRVQVGDSRYGQLKDKLKKLWARVRS